MLTHLIAFLVKWKCSFPLKPASACVYAILMGVDWCECTAALTPVCARTGVFVGKTHEFFPLMFYHLHVQWWMQQRPHSGVYRWKCICPLEARIWKSGPKSDISFNIGSHLYSAILSTLKLVFGTMKFTGNVNNSVERSDSQFVSRGMKYM